MNQLDPLAQEILTDLAILGRGITQTYSEGNQDFGGDLMMAKSTVQQLGEKVEALDIPVNDKKGIQKLLDYFDKKIERRLNGGKDKPF